MRLENSIRGMLVWSFILFGPTAPLLAYQSPYKVEFTVPLQELCSIDSRHPRNDPRLESRIPYDEWYSRRVRRVFGAWGPSARHYGPIEGFEKISPAWKRQRVLAVACGLMGLPYQHHHIPDWDPPGFWPWKPVAYGRNSKGIDCSDFTSWLYNFGLGIYLPTGISTQSEKTMLRGPGGQGTVEARAIRSTGSYEDLISKLKAGDLLYIKNKSGKVSHVIMWVGEYGRAPDNAPLVIDCTGPEHRDCEGNQIPIGVQLRPFLRNGWYYQSFSHAHRIIGEPLE